MHPWEWAGCCLQKTNKKAETKTQTQGQRKIKPRQSQTHCTPGQGAVYTRQIKRLRQKTQTEKIRLRQTQTHCIPAQKKEKAMTKTQKGGQRQRNIAKGTTDPGVDYFDQ